MSSWFWAYILCTPLELTCIINTAIITAVKINCTVFQKWILLHFAAWVSKLAFIFVWSWTWVLSIFNLTSVTPILPDFAVGPIYCFYYVLVSYFGILFVFLCYLAWSFLLFTECFGGFGLANVLTALICNVTIRDTACVASIIPGLAL